MLKQYGGMQYIDMSKEQYIDLSKYTYKDLRPKVKMYAITQPATLKMDYKIKTKIGLSFEELQTKTYGDMEQLTYGELSEYLKFYATSINTEVIL